LGGITYTTDLGGVDWEQLKATLAADDFDNGRTPAQLRESFANSFVAVVASDGGRVIGTARALSDGVSNAYVVDVWTLSPYRGRGVARAMMRMLEARLAGQHVHLFTETAVGFYKKLGFREAADGAEQGRRRVVEGRALKVRGGEPRRLKERTELDTAAYLERIGYRGPLEPTAETLRPCTSRTCSRRPSRT